VVTPDTISSVSSDTHSQFRIVRMLVVGAFGLMLIMGCVMFFSERTYIGLVTTTRVGRVCVGGLAASGECFWQDAVTRDLRVNDCVRVTYTPNAGIEVPATAHTRECPAP
jgi:hypothetical protein